MANFIFSGEYKHSLDSKGRVSIPAKFRNQMGDIVVILKGIDECLYIVAKDFWQKEVDKIINLPITNENSRLYKRLTLGMAHEREIDRLGRILIPQPLKEYASIKKEVVFLGIGDRVEIWALHKWQEYEKENCKVGEIAKRLNELNV